MALNDWMSAIPNATQLNQIIMPGAHDAGMVLDHGLFHKAAAVGANESNAGTQGLPIGRGTVADSVTQLESGVRWFDVRLKKRPDKCNGPAGFRCFHSTTFGESSRSIANGIVAFLQANSSETVIVCLTKSTFSGKNDKKNKPATVATAANDAYKAFLTDLDAAFNAALGDPAPPIPPYERGNKGQIASLKLGGLRGRVIVAMDNPPKHARNYRVLRAYFKKWDGKAFPKNGEVPHVAFDKRKASGTYDFVLNAAGTYSNANSVKDIVKGQQKRMANILKAMNPRDNPWLALFYATNTANIINPKKLVKGQGFIGMRTSSIRKQDSKTWTQDARNRWIQTAVQKGAPDAYPVANVVMLDFADERRCGFIRDFAGAAGY